MTNGAQPPPLRIRATQPISPTGIQPIEDIPSSQENIDALQGLALDNFQDSVRTITEGRQGSNQILNNIASSLIGVQEANQLAESYNNIRSGSNTAEAAINVVTTAFDAYNQIQSARRETKRQQSLVQLEQDKQLFLGEAENVLRNPQQGRRAYETQARQFISRYAGVLSPDEIVNLTSELFAPYQSYSQEEARATFGTLDQVANTRANISEAEISIELSALSTRIANSRTVEEANEATVQAIGRLNELTQGLPPYIQLSVTSSILTGIQEQYGDRVGKLGEFVNALENQQNYARDYAQYVQPLIDNGQFIEAGDVESRLGLFYGIDRAERRTDPLRAFEYQDQYRTYQRNVNEAVRAGWIEQFDSQQFTDAQIADLAYIIVNDPVRAAGFDAAFQETTLWQQATTLAEAFNNVQESGDQLNTQILRINEEIARLQTTSNQTILSNLQNPDSIDDTLLGLSLAASFDSGLQSILQQYQQAKLEQDPEQRRQLVQSILDSQGQIISVLESQAQELQRQYDNDAQILRQYQIYSPTDFEARAAGASTTIEGIQQRIQDARNAAVSNLGATPNFSLPGLATTSTATGAQAVLPFMQSSQSFNITGQLAEDRGTHLHAGIDIAINHGTPIVFYTQGEVTQVRTDDVGGYGYYIDIRSPDGHIHRFAHLSDMQVSVGQQVVPGQVIGLGGSTGRSTGPHLHWEVRREGGPLYGYDPNSVMTPFDYTSQLSTNPRQERSSGIGGRAVNDRQYASINASDYTFNPDNNYGYAQLAEDSSFRTRLHSVSREVGIPTQWLADVMAFESNFSANVWNQGGAPAVGLIQFYADPGTGGRYGTKTIRGNTYRLQDIARMNRIEQLNLVQDYMLENRPSDGFQSPYEVLAAIFGGPGLLRRLRENPDRAMRTGDGDISFGNYMQELGSHVGRQYEPLGRPQPIRTR